MSTDQNEPVIRFVQGNPTPEEIAAVVAVLTSRGAQTEPPPPAATGWSGYWRRTRRSMRPGPDAWRMSLRP